MERSKIGLLLAKKESTYGTDPTPTGTADVITVAGLVTYANETDVLDRDILDGDLSPVKGTAALPRAKISFEYELRGNRTDGTVADISKGSSSNALDIDCLLQACDLAPTYTAETTTGARDGGVTYKPTVPSGLGQSVTFYFYTGLKLHKITGAKGTFKITLKAGSFGRIAFDFMGIDAGTSDASLPGTITWPVTLPPIIKTSGSGNVLVKGGTSGTSNSLAAVLDEFTLDLGNQIIRRDSVNSSTGVVDFINVARNSTCTLNPEAVTESSHPFFADLIAGNPKTLSFALTGQNGNAYGFNLAAVTRSIAYADKNGTRIANVAFDIRRKDLTQAIGSELQLTWLNSGF